MAETVKVPGFGQQSKKTTYLVGGGIVLVLGVAYYRSHKAKQAAAANAAATTSQIDPATGFAYGSAEDAAALASQSAYQNPINYGGGGGPSSTTGVTSGGFTSNAQWTQAAETALNSTPPDAISAALGKYILGEPLSDAEHSFVAQAIAAEGFPPVAGPSGYPPSLKTGAPAAPGGGTVTSYHYAVQLHKLSAPESGRELITRFSDASVASPTRVEVALQATVSDPKNAIYRDYFSQHGGVFPAGAITTHVVKTGG